MEANLKNLKSRIIKEYQDNKSYYEEENKEINKMIQRFQDEYSPNKLKKMKDEELIKEIFDQNGMFDRLRITSDKQNILYSKEMKKFHLYYNFYNCFPLYYEKKSKNYILGDKTCSKITDKIKQEGRKIVNIILLYNKYIEKMLLNNDQIDFLSLIDKVKKDKDYNLNGGEKRDYFIATGWGVCQKYFYLIYPDQFVMFYSNNIIDMLLKLLENNGIINNNFNNDYFKKLQYVISFIRDIQKENKNITNYIFYSIIGKFLKGDFPLNQILYGPAGTGKTYNTIREALKIIIGKKFKEKNNLLQIFNKYKQQGQIEFITFHQSYSYEDFIEGIKPNLDGDNVHYKVVPGIFKTFVKKALVDTQKNHVLIIDEINRGNISKIFGELITLIEEDKRNEAWSVKLPYSQESFYIPNNLYIIGTMNTSDRSIASIDIALRRRFDFIEMMPDNTKVDKEIEGGINLSDLLDNINNKITILLDRDHQIGHSYFMKVGSFEDLKEVWFNEIIPLLNEYFYNDFEKLNLIIPDFIKEIDNPFKNIKNNSDYNDTYYEFKTLKDIDGENFIKYLNNIIDNNLEEEKEDNEDDDEE